MRTYFINSLKLETSQLKGVNKLWYLYIFAGVSVMGETWRQGFTCCLGWPGTFYTRLASNSLPFLLQLLWPWDCATTPGRTEVYTYSGLLFCNWKPNYCELIPKTLTWIKDARSFLKSILVIQLRKLWTGKSNLCDKSLNNGLVTAVRDRLERSFENQNHKNLLYFVWGGCGCV